MQTDENNVTPGAEATPVVENNVDNQEVSAQPATEVIAETQAEVPAEQPVAEEADKLANPHQDDPGVRAAVNRARALSNKGEYEGHKIIGEVRVVSHGPAHKHYLEFDVENGQTFKILADQFHDEVNA